MSSGVPQIKHPVVATCAFEADVMLTVVLLVNAVMTGAPVAVIAFEPKVLSGVQLFQPIACLPTSTAALMNGPILLFVMYPSVPEPDAALRHEIVVVVTAEIVQVMLNVPELEFVTVILLPIAQPEGTLRTVNTTVVPLPLTVPPNVCERHVTVDGVAAVHEQALACCVFAAV